jgi:hypothetical protein
VRNLVANVAGLLLICCDETSAQTTGRPYELHSAMPAYWQFARENMNSTPAVRLRAFRTHVIAPQREAWNSVAFRWLEDDASLSRFMDALEPNARQFHRVDSLFSLRMDRAWARFQAYAPDLKRGAPVFLLPAPRIAVGGSVRPLTKQNAIVLGSEELSTVIESQASFNVLVNHEMTHLYHLQVNPEMRNVVAEVYMPPYAPADAKLYQVLWLEGLAAYTSKVLNPSATDKQVLLSDSVASQVRALWPAIGADIRKHLDSGTKDDLDKYLFDGRVSSRFPPRAGYYVGMLLAAKLSEKHSFAMLCRLHGAELRVDIEEALRALEGSTPDS